MSLSTKDDKITMPTLTKLLKIKRVASSSWGLAKSFKIILARALLEFLMLALSLGFKEKNALSELEVKAERAKSTKMITR